MKYEGDIIYISKEDRDKLIDFKGTEVKKSLMSYLPVLRDYDFEKVCIENIIEQLAKDGYILPIDGRVESRLFWGAAVKYILSRKGMEFRLEQIPKSYPLKNYKRRNKR